MKYEVSFSFFIENDDSERFERVKNELQAIDEIEDLDYYDDGEDYCLDCIAYINVKDSTPKNRIVDSISKVINQWMRDWYAAWDYHYVSGGNGFKWQP